MELSPDWFPLDYLPHWILAFAATIVLQRLRRKLKSAAYAIVWSLVLVSFAIWGGEALITYVTRFYAWRRAFVFLPGIVVACLCANLFSRLRFVRSFAIVSLLLAVAWACLTAIEYFDVWTQLLGPPAPKSGGPFLGAGGEVVEEMHWYTVASPGIAVLMAALFVRPRFFAPGGVFPLELPALAVWRLPDSPIEAPRRRFDILLPQRPLSQMSILDLIFVTSGVVAMLVSYKAQSTSVFCYTAGVLGGLLGTKSGVARSYRRLEFSLAGAIIGAGICGLVAAYYVELTHDRWHWIGSTWQRHAAPTAKIVKFVPFVVLPRAVLIGLLSATLYLLLLALNKRLSSR